jgi:hypothetical protein
MDIEQLTAHLLVKMNQQGINAGQNGTNQERMEANLCACLEKTDAWLGMIKAR